MARLKLATVWLAGCSGCHMSFLDLDEWLAELAARADIVFSPLVDIKEFPHGVDVTLVEGAVANEDNLAMAKTVRERSAVVIAFGDCAVTGNVTAMRNPLGGPDVVLRRSYVELPTLHGAIPVAPGVLPPLLDRVRPLHEVIPVDLHLPGCPPDAAKIRAALDAVTRGERPDLSGEMIRFG
jgi:NAD-reducing hydrogenase small subunit